MTTTVAIAAAQAVQETLQQYLKQQGPPLPQDTAVEAREWIETIIGLPEYYRIEEETTER
ncbi:hypothetical protein [Candidatus Entotheonella palauensis]|uniref:hypothetical protein n=1 Tax=Candidatus Entotheonella palauensis TaxID=93172 RepID=UPI000B7E968A|nr:hypothetical protein [Candidatus Entotheonella palauensis]